MSKQPVVFSPLAKTYAGRTAWTKPGPDHELDHGPDHGPDHGSDHRSDQGKNFNSNSLKI